MFGLLWVLQQNHAVLRRVLSIQDLFEKGVNLQKVVERPLGEHEHSGSAKNPAKC